MKNINTKQMVMTIGIAALSVLSLSAHAGNRDHNDRHSDKRSFYNDNDSHRHGRQHRSHHFGHPRFNHHRRAKRHSYYNAYSRNRYGYGNNHHRQERHHDRYQRGHSTHLLPSIRGQIHLPGIRLNLHL